jgi:hypothetical protein
MNADFESSLQRQPLRELPRDWRADILAAAGSPESRPAVMGNLQSAIRNPQSSHGSTESRPALPAFPDALPVEVASTWPSLRAWAGLAAVWLVILLLHVTAQDEPRLARNSSSMSLQSFAMLHQQTLMMAQLLAQPDQANAGEPPAALPAPPKPRSEIARKQLVG